MKNFAWLSPVFLCGCFLNQSAPGPVKTPTPFKGGIVMETMQISNQGVLGTVNAEFELVAPPAPDKTDPAPAASARHLQTLRGRMQAATAYSASTRAGECETQTRLIREPQSQPLGLDVGTMIFGPADQNFATKMIQTEDLRYGATISPFTPAGQYAFVASGVGKIDAFGEKLSFPEAVASLRLNGRDFGDPTFALDTKEDLVVFWRAPGIENAQNLVLLNLIANDDKYVYSVYCQKAEDQVLDIHGYREWRIDARLFADFPVKGKVQFYMTRGHLIRSKGRVTDINLLGLRTYYAHLDRE